jgi:sarcosine oxidase
VAAFDVIVVGLGAMGSAAAAHAAARGQRVLGLEQFQPGHAEGSSHGRSRVIRLAYFEHPAYVPLLRRAYELWRRLEADTGRRLLQMTGGLMIGAANSAVVSGSLRSAREHGLEYELLDAGALHRRFPPFTPRQEIVALFEKEAGSLFPEDCIGSHLEVATRHGATLGLDERVEDWRVVSTDTIEVITTRAAYRCGRLILTPGPWAASLFKLPRLPLEVEPQVLYWFDPSGGSAPFAPERFPIYIWDEGGGVQFYGFPADERGLVKVAFFRSAKKDEASMRASLQPRLPALGGGRIMEQVTCKYTMTPDQHFVIGRHPDYSNVVVASPCSGHGFKFASVIGEILTDLATLGETRHPVGLFSPSRFL